MDDKLVYDCNLVLSTTLNENLWVNKVIKKTGLARNRGLEVIKYLENSEIITKKGDKKHRQKEIINLTEFGRDLALFNESLSMFEEAHERLLARINADFNDCEKKFFNKKMSALFSHTSNRDNSHKQEFANIDNQKNKFLEAKGWSNMEIQNFNIWRVTSNKIKIYLIDVAIEFIMFKHRIYLLRYKLNQKERTYC